MPADIASALSPVWLSRAETASRIKQRIHAVMQWGWAHGYCSANPADVVTHLLPRQVSAHICAGISNGRSIIPLITAELNSAALEFGWFVEKSAALTGTDNIVTNFSPAEQMPE